MQDSGLTTTTALIGTLRAGHDDAMWSLFVARYRPVLLSIARRLGLSEPDAADAAQQTLLEFVRDIRDGRYDRSRGRLRSWLASIAEHRCRDFLRSARVRRPAEPLPEDLDERRSVLERWWDEAEEAEIAVAAWEEIRRKHASRADRSIEAFELVAMRNVPPSEAARHLGMTVEALYAAKYRVAHRLRAAIERHASAWREDPR
jgi:RNA polymerase sigma factor (sigma-70 family)